MQGGVSQMSEFYLVMDDSAVVHTAQNEVDHNLWKVYEQSGQWEGLLPTGLPRLVLEIISLAD